MTAPTPASAGPSLQEQLDTITANTRALVPPERLARTEAVISELRATGIEDHLLQPGALAPGFALSASNGKLVRSSDLLALGPVVIKFFRGRWCPYDVTELEAWQALQPALRDRRALLVAISPQMARQNAFTAERHKLTFPLLSDPGAAIAETFGIAHTVPEPTRLWYRSMLVNIPFLNGDQTWRLPLPATFLLDANGTVRYSRAFADHRLRPEPAEVLALL